MIRRFLENGERLAGFYQFTHRARQNYKAIIDDCSLLAQFVIKHSQNPDAPTDTLQKYIEINRKLKEFYETKYPLDNEDLK